MKAYASKIEKRIFENREVSRKELAELTGLSLSAISNYVGRLIKKEILVEVERKPGSGKKNGAGRPSVPLALNASLAFSLGCEVKNNRVLTEVVDIAGGRRNFLEFKGEIKDESGFLRLLFKAIEMSIRDAPCPEKVSSIGVCLSGSVNFGKGLIVHSPAVCDLKNVYLEKILEEKFTMPTIIENNARSMGFAEIHFSPGKDYRDILFVSVKEGIGSAIILGGKVFRGGHDMGGEVGHIIVDNSPYAPFCSCGNRGCLQAVASCSAMVRRAGELAMEGIRTSLGTGMQGITFDMLVEEARSGDKVAMIVFDEAAGNLASGIGNVLNVLNPELVIIGGHITRAKEFFEPRLYDLLKTKAVSEVTENLKLEFSRLGEDEAAYGAAMLAKKKIKVIPIMKDAEGGMR